MMFYCLLFDSKVPHVPGLNFCVYEKKRKKVLDVSAMAFLDFDHHRTIYNMCTQRPPYDYSQQLYDKYKEAFEEYIRSTVRKPHLMFLLYAVFSFAMVIFDMWCD